MIPMHCPACGAEGRIPNEKVNVRLTCKRCLEAFHMTPGGKIVFGPPPAASSPPCHGHDGHELDVVEHEIDVVVDRLRSAGPKVAAAGGLAVAALLGWSLVWGGKVESLDDQSIRIARAFVMNDLSALHALAVEGTVDEVVELSAALLPEFRPHAEFLQASAPTVEVARLSDSPGPGLSQVVASIRTDRPVSRVGVALPDVSTSMTPAGTIDLPIVLAGDDRQGWRLDGERTLEAYRKARTPAATGRPGKSGGPAGTGLKSAPTANAVAAPRA